MASRPAGPHIITIYTERIHEVSIRVSFVAKTMLLNAKQHINQVARSETVGLCTAIY